MIDGQLAIERGPQLRGVVVAASDELVVQLIIARHARSRLMADEIRDVKLSTLLIEIDSGHLSGRLHLGSGSFVYDDSSCARLASLGGLSRERFAIAVRRLLEASALVVRENMGAQQFVFAERVLRPAGAAEYVDWQSVSARLQGRTPAFLVLRSVLDAMRTPWDWISLTYELLAEHSCYSLGMVRHGIAQLVNARVLDRTTHAGRGHGYRCSAWALGRASWPAPPPVVVPEGNLADHRSSSQDVAIPLAAEPLSKSQPVESSGGSAGDCELTVEIGGLVLRLPIGTEIRMQVEPGGISSYTVGPHLRFKQEIPRQ